MTREEAIEQIYTRISKEIAYKEQFYSVIEALERLKEPITIAEFLGWEDGQEYEWRGDIFRIQSDILQVWDEDDERWYDATEELNDYLRLRQAKKVEPKLKAWHVKDEYSFNCLMKELEKEGRTYCNVLTWEDVKKYEGNIVIYEHINHLTYGNLHLYNIFPRTQEKFDLIEYHKEEPRYLLQTDLTSENGVQYLSFDKKRKKYFIGALIASKNVQQKFTGDEISKIKLITRFAKLCEMVEVK